MANALKTGDYRHTAFGKLFFHSGDINIFNTRRTVHIAGFHGNLPAQPRTCSNAQILQSHGQKPDADLFTGRYDDIIFARIMQPRHITGQPDQTIGLTRHGRNHNRHFVAGFDFARHMRGDIADAINITDRRAAKFHDQTCHCLFRVFFRFNRAYIGRKRAPA